MTKVYKILSRTDWTAAEARGVFTGSTLDIKDGYIHLSTAEQAGETARIHFRGQEDLLLVTLDAEKLGPAVKWEPARGGQLFPHLHRPLKTSEADAVRDLALNAEGWPDPGPLDPGVLVL